jgi:hypothetical protein
MNQTGRSDEDEEFIANFRSLSEDERKKAYDGAEEIRRAIATPPIDKDKHVRSYETSLLIQRHDVWKVTGKA